MEKHRICYFKSPKRKKDFSWKDRIRTIARKVESDFKIVLQMRHARDYYDYRG